MSGENRREQIILLVNQHRYMLIEDLCRLLDTSSATMRTDLEYLHNEGALIRLRGVALSKIYSAGDRPEADGGSDAMQVRDFMVSEKKALVRSCLRLLQARDSIFLDTSNTNYYFARALAEQAETPLTVLTNSLDIFGVLRSCPHINPVLSGGDYEMTTNSLVGDHAIRFIRGMNANFAFITAHGFDLERGVNVYYSRNTAIRRTMMESAGKTVIMCDHSKFQNTGVELLCSWNDVDIIASDAAPPKAFTLPLAQYGIQLLEP